MSTLLFGMNAPQYKQSDSLEKVRSTVTTVTDDSPSVAVSEPEFGRLETDPNTDGGLTPHQVASKRTGGDRYPSDTARTARADHSQALNNRWSDSGTAAHREAAGEWGHGTLRVQDSMTRPEDGTEFSETYFARDRRGMNEQVGNYMSPATGPDQETLDKVQEVGKVRAQDRESENPYVAMYRNLMNGVQ